MPFPALEVNSILSVLSHTFETCTCISPPLPSKVHLSLPLVGHCPTRMMGQAWDDTQPLMDAINYSGRQVYTAQSQNWSRYSVRTCVVLAFYTTPPLRCMIVPASSSGPYALA